MYFKTDKEKKKGKIGLLITVRDSSNLSDDKLFPMDKKSVIHFIFSTLIKKEGGIQTIESVVASINLGGDISYGIHSIGRHNAFVNYDICKRVHSQAYVRNVCHAESPEEREAFDGNEEDTRFIVGMTSDAWQLSFDFLSKIRNRRIAERVQEPRTSKKQFFANDHIDKAISQIIARVNGIMGEILYWGDERRIYRISTNE